MNFETKEGMSRVQVIDAKISEVERRVRHVKDIDEIIWRTEKLNDANENGNMVRKVQFGSLLVY